MSWKKDFLCCSHSKKHTRKMKKQLRKVKKSTKIEGDVEKQLSTSLNIESINKNCIKKLKKREHKKFIYAIQV